MRVRGKVLDIFLIITFIFIIFTPGFGIFIQKDPNKIKALNREPYLFPTIDLRRINHTDFRGIDNWFADKALFITSLSKYWSDFNYKLRASAKPDSTIIGKNGWLYLGNGYASTIDQYTGKNLPTEEETIRQLNAFKQMNQIAKNKHIPFLVVIAPDKQEIYPEYLPKYIRKGSSQSRLDRLEIGLHANNIDFIDLRAEELNAKNTLAKQYGDLYLKGDSHWNHLGAYVAYQAISNYLNKKGIHTNQLRFNFIPGSQKITDLAGFLQLTDIESNAPLPDVSNLKIKMLGKDISGAMHPLSIFDGNQLNIILKAPYQYINTALRNSQTCLLISDSFSEALGFYFHNDFHSTIRIHSDNKNYGLSQLINMYHPNIIVFEKVERELINYSNNFQSNSETG